MARIDRRAALGLVAAAGLAAAGRRGCAAGEESTVAAKRKSARAMIYLDNAATSFPKPEPVYEAIEGMLRTDLANPWEGPYRISAESLRVMERARQRLDEFFRGAGPDRWVHAFNGTDALNIAIKGTLKPGDRVVTTDLEHDAVTRPLNALERAGVITQVRVKSDLARGIVDPDAIRAALAEKAALVAMTHASNLTGAIQPIEAIAPIVREAGALFLVDAAQSAGQVPIDLRATPIDLLACSGHKGLFGPTGTGVLYVGPRAAPRPWREGDTGGEGSAKDPFQPEGLPSRLEGGTPNVLGIAGLDAGVAWVAERGPDHLRRQVVDLLRQVAEWAGAAGWRVVGPWSPDACIGVLSLVPKGRGPKAVTEALDRRHDIAARPGLHDALYANQALGTYPEGTLRLSPGPFTTAGEVAALIAALEQIDAGRG